MVEILEHPDGVELLFFNGIMDMVCNHVGNERSLQHLPWKHNEDWNMAPRYAWRASSEEEGKVSGYMREFGTLKFLKINSAGHMVR
jgi:carboxypeptidase C (cathepsin A)